MSGATLPGHAQVVIIGGGVMGCSTAYHLTKQGCDDVVLLERGKLTNGTTWHSAAMVRQLRSTVSLTQLTKYSARLYASLAEETGQETGWRQCGSISIATTPDRLTHIRRQASLARAFGVEAYEIGVDEIAGMWPFANLDDVIGGVYSPDDGRVNPTDLCAALVKGAKAGGARIFEDTAVTEILVSDGRITGVRTPAGDVHCEKVVLCGGLWSRELAREIGVSVPLHACEHYALVTRAIDEVQLGMPILGDHDNHMYIRDEAGGLLVGCFEPNARPVDLADLPNDFSFDLLKEDWDHFEPVMLNVLKRIPLLEHAEVRTLINGPESFTPDNNFLLGETPEVRGLYVGCGMNSVGMASGGGAGYALAAWVLDDAPPMDLWSVDIRRFGNFRNNVRTLRQRAAESLSKHYAIAYPGREPETARNLRVTPLYPRQVAAGAHFGERSGWERPSFYLPDAGQPNLELKFGKPGWFDLVAEEHRAARERVALFDQSTLGKLLVQGRDALAFLQRICANDVDAGANRLVYTPMLNNRGGYESDVVVLRLDEESFLVATGAAQPVRDLHRLKRLREDDEAVTVCDMTSAYAVIGVMGPRSRDLMKRLSDDSFSNDDFPFLSHREIEVGNTVARALRVSYVGELGWEIYVPSDAALPLYDEIRAAGEDFGVRDAGTFALGSLRTEKGFCSWGHDIGPDDTPLEAGMNFTVKLDKQIPFIGREALLRQKEEGIGKRRVMLQLADPEIHLQGSEPIMADDAVVGHTTSAAYGHTLGASVAMGYIRLDGAKAREVVETASFEVEVAGERMPAKASLQAFFDPSSERMRVDDPVV